MGERKEPRQTKGGECGDRGKGEKYPDFFLAVVTLSPLHYRLHRDRALSPILSLHSEGCRVEFTSCFLAAFATLQFLC